MKIETPQILWHNGTENDNGKNAPLYSAALLPVGVLAQHDDNDGNANANPNPNASSSSRSRRSRQVLATAGNTSEIHLWEVTFRSGDKDGGGNDDENDGGSSSGQGGPKAKRQRILQSAASTIAAVKHSTKPSSSGGGPGPSSSSSSSSSSAYSSPNTEIRHLLTLSRQIDRTINCIEFSPDGQHLAAVGDGGAVFVFTLPSPDANTSSGASPSSAKAKPTPAGQAWSALPTEKSLHTKILPTPSTEDVMDISWSADSKRFVVGCLDHTVVVYENANHAAAAAAAGAGGSAAPATGAVGSAVPKGDQPQQQDQSASSATAASASATATVAATATEEPKWRTVHRSTNDHLGYVQGVTYDPLGVYVASQGSDRTVRVYARKKVKNGKKTPSEKDKGKASEGGGGVLTPTDQNATSGASGGGSGSGNDSENPSTNDGIMDSDAPPQGVGMPTNQAHPNHQEELHQREILVQKKMQAQADTQRALTETKFELGRGKIIKFRSNANANANATSSSAESKSSAAAASAAGDKKGAASAPSADDKVLGEKSDENKTESDAAATATATANANSAPLSRTNNQRRHHLYADESTVESFFRRLSWTVDGSYLVTPAALWHGSDDDDDDVDDEKEKEENDPQQQQQQQRQKQPPSFATYLFARHNFDGPCRVLAGLEKPSVVIRPNPVLFKLPPPSAADAPSSSKENDPATVARSGAMSTPAKKQRQNHHPPTHRSIFAVLTLDTVLVYDTYHTRPLCVARGLHYAGLTDAAWSDDGLHLIVTSTDGYVSILGFEDGELGEVYTPPPITRVASVATGETETTAAVAPPSQRLPVPEPLPPCEPGQTATIVAPPAKKARIDDTSTAPSLVVAEPPEAMEASTCALDSSDEAKKAKRRVVPIPVIDATKGTDDDEEEKGASHTEVMGGVTNLSLEGKKDEEKASEQEPKKKKKRVQPMLVSCEQ